MTTYIQRHGDGQTETVDEFETASEARAMLREYRMSDPSAHYYTSRRPCKNWVDEVDEGPDEAIFETLVISSFFEGARVRYVPQHAEGDETHHDCEIGEVTSMNDKFVFVKYGDGDTSVATRPEDLRWEK